jgi:rod shape-determining protein MreB and related proteins
MTPTFFSRLRKSIADPDMAIDLGTANTRLYAHGCGLLADEPSIVKLRADTGAIESVGISAAFSFKTPDYAFVSPLSSGVVTDIKAAAALLSPMMRRARRLGLLKPRVLTCAPTDACEDERAALVEATRRAGASAVAVAPEPLAAAIGIGMDVSSEHAQMLVDIGDGITDIAVIRSGELIITDAERTACSDLTRAVQQLVARRHGVELYAREAEQLIRKVGAAGRRLPASPYVVAGDDCRTRQLRRVGVYGQEVAGAIDPVLKTIVSAVGRIVRKLPPEISCEVVESGIRLTGGGACLSGITDLIAAETKLEVSAAKDPMRAVINGARQMLAVGMTTNLWMQT